MIRVLVVDDHDLVRKGISRLLNDTDQVSVIGECDSGEAAIEFVRQHEPDIVLMDIHMPGIGGMEATRKIIQHNPLCKVIIVTVADDDPFTSRLLKIGASGYMTKGAKVEEMLFAINKVNLGQRYLSPDIAQKMALSPFDTESSSPFDVLSEREMQIALMIVQCQKVPQISDALFLSPKTVNGYRYRIFEKLGIDGDVELTHLAIRFGLVDVAEIGH